MRVPRFRRAHLPHARLAAVVLSAAAVVAAPLTVLATAGSAAADTSTTTDTVDTPPLARVVLSAPATVTKGVTTRLSAHLTLGPLDVPGRSVAFLARPVGTTTWTTIATAQTDRNGMAVASSRAINVPTEFGAYYTDAAGAVHSDTSTTVVHTIDMKGATAKTVYAGVRATVTNRLVKDVTTGLASRAVSVFTRTSATGRWSGPWTLRTNSSGFAAWPHSYSRTTYVGMRFAGGGGLARSPLAVTKVTVKTVTASSSGFVFPFLYRSQAQSVGSWSEDQGVDLAAKGYACGSNAILVAVGDGVVIQEGISGFGPTAPVLRMTSGPFKGRNVYYGHTGHVYVSVGAHVRAGQRLAQIGCGSVGYSSAPHLEIGVGVPGGPPCCPAMHQTSSLMMRELVAALRA